MKLNEDPYDLLTYSKSDEIDVIQSVLRDYQPETSAVKECYLTSLSAPPDFITNYEQAAISFGLLQLGLHTVSRVKYDEKAGKVYTYFS